MKQPPTWQDVGMPENFISRITKCTNLSAVLSFLVFHNELKTVHSYYCNACGYNYTPERSHDEVGGCKRCGLLEHLSCQSTLAFTSRINNNYDILTIIQKMQENYFAYFNEEAKRSYDCGWQDNLYYFEFCGGDRISCDDPRQSVIKAAICCPYLWNREINSVYLSFIVKMIIIGV